MDQESIMKDDEIRIEVDGYGRVHGYLGRHEVMSMSRLQCLGEWIVSGSCTLPSDPARAALYLDCMSRVFAKVAEIDAPKAKHAAGHDGFNRDDAFQNALRTTMPPLSEAGKLRWWFDLGVDALRSHQRQVFAQPSVARGEQISDAQRAALIAYGDARESKDPDRIASAFASALYTLDQAEQAGLRGPDRESRAMLVARLEATRTTSYTGEEVIALIDDCDMLASRDVVGGPKVEIEVSVSQDRPVNR
jgi:hypothetical protein